MTARSVPLGALVLAGALLAFLLVSSPGVAPDDVLGVLLQRFAWLGSWSSLVVWLFALRQVWRVEGSVHHLVARVLSITTIVALDVALILIFWPAALIPPPVELGIAEIRVMVAFIVGMSVMAGFWQVTAPRQARVPRIDGKRYR